MKLEPVNIICPACGNGNYMRHLIGENVGYLNMKCINYNSYFNSDELYKRRVKEVWKPKPITNADRIRMMSDEELAEMLHNAGCNWYSEEYWLDWLKGTNIIQEE